MTMHASDKAGRDAKLIGAKGLGFRALLNWSHEPIIFSGALEIAFSGAHAASIIDDLAARSLGIARICQREEEKPVPVLAIPATGDWIERLTTGKGATLLSQARTLRSHGYDTVVAAPFDDERAFERAVNQASEFKPTFLLFVESLAEIELRVEGRPTVRWTRRTIGSDTYGLDIEIAEDRTTQTWICHRKRGELAVRRGRKTDLYELAIALRPDGENAPGYLHSYFLTSIPLPFHALLHATFELDSNRKTIKENSDLNQAVLGELAGFYAATLAKLAKGRNIENALDFLARASAFPDPLKDFEAATYRAARLLPLVPTMRGGRAAAADTEVGPVGYEQYLPARLFNRLAKCRHAEERRTLERLGVDALDPGAIIRILRKAELTLEERARAIVGVARALDAKYHHPGLLLDQNGRQMTASSTAFPPPVTGQQLPKLPDWARARFILPELWRLIVRRADGQTPRDKIRQLSGFGISEYSNESVIASLRSQAAKALLRGRRDADEVQRELLLALYSLYSPENRQPPGIFKVRCEDGQWRDTRETHLSAAYGTIGRINSALYRTALQFLIGGPMDNGLDADGANLAAFFEWLGVNRWPHEAMMAVPADLRGAIIKALPDTITVRDSNVHQTFRRADISWGYNFQAQCSMITGLEEILASAESDAILVWIAQDPRFDQASPRPFITTATGRKDGKASFRRYEGPLPDLVRELIATKPWLACRDGAHHSPTDAMIQPGRLAELFNTPRPAAAGSDKAFGLNQPMWRRGLEQAQVPYSLSDLSEARIFGLLRSLPDRDPSVEVVRRLYLQIIELDAFDKEAALTEHRDFLTSGRVQVHRGHVRDWVAPAQALYADRDGFPLAAREHLALIDLPARRNSGDVIDRLGVAPLSKQKFRLAVTNLDEETGLLAATLRSDLASAKPYIRALRLANSNETQRLRRFERLALKIARAADIEVTIGDQKILGRLEPWTHVLERDVLIVAIESYREPTQITALAPEAIADGIAELFEIQSGADFAKLLSTNSPELRRILLRRMLPNQSDEELDGLLADAGPPDEDYEPVQVDAETLARGPAQGPATEQKKASEISKPTAPAAAGGETVAPTPRTPATPTAGTSVQLTVGGKAPPSSQPMLPASTPGIRVARATGPTPSPIHHDPHRAADAEEWTRLFEVSQGRVPLNVAHLQGRDAYGCDCLSFESENDLDIFRADPKRVDLVLRFIETKSGGVHLTDSEVRAAERRGPHYFIYRVEFYSGSREFAELTIVCNPLNYKAALVSECELRIDDVADRERYQLTPTDA